jgi:hypothetical protein
LQELKEGAQSEKDYYKETMRDALGNVLPAAIGDFVRATPRGVDAPAGTYTAWNPETQSYEERQSNSPVNVADEFANQRFDAGFNTSSPYNVNSDFFVGAQTPQSLPSRVNDLELTQMLEAYKQPGNNSTGLQDLLDTNDYGGMQENVFNPSSGAGGDFAPRMETPADMGIAGGKFSEYYQDAYKRGGQIRRGKR